MKSATKCPMKVLATGFIVLVFLSLPLFWIRFICEKSITTGMPDETQSIDRVQPCGIVPAELENDPNVAHHSSVSARLQSERLFLSLGIAHHLSAMYPGGGRSSVHFLAGEEWMYFDQKSGQLVCNYLDTQIMPDKSAKAMNVRVFIGPKGISETPDRTLGRFTEIIIDGSWNLQNQRSARELVAYDKRLRCFFKIDLIKKTVVKGPELLKDVPREPIQIGRLQKNDFSMYFAWWPPRTRVSGKNPGDDGLRGDYQPIIPTFYDGRAGPYVLVLDRTGRIDLLDKDTLEFVRIACWRLPAPETYFGTAPSVMPKDLLAYEVRPLTLSKFYLEDGRLLKMTFGEAYEPERAASRVDREYLGMFATSVSRDGTAMALAVFDAQGNQIKTEYTRLPQSRGYRTDYLPSSKTAYWQARWAPVSTISKYLAENLHPPILSLASYFTASTFEAGSGHRALFLLPNSFVAMIARDSRGHVAEKLFSALWLIFPSILLAIWLACRVSKDAALVGLSRKARRWWMLGTIAFGLAGYITYRLTRPKVTLVTCANCGHPRRPDMDKCHRCASQWHVPELTPPAWRVLDGDVAERTSGYQVTRVQDIRGSG